VEDNHAYGFVRLTVDLSINFPVWNNMSRGFNFLNIFKRQIQSTYLDLKKWMEHFIGKIVFDPMEIRTHDRLDSFSAWKYQTASYRSRLLEFLKVNKLNIILNNILDLINFWKPTKYGIRMNEWKLFIDPFVPPGVSGSRIRMNYLNFPHIFFFKK
jgi:hypothetical protein